MFQEIHKFVFKENVIISKLPPAGTGMNRHLDIDINAEVQDERLQIEAEEREADLIEE